MDSDVPAEILTDRSASRRTDEMVVRAASDRPSDASDRRPEGRCDDDSGERAGADEREVERLEREVERLERDVERKEQQLRCVTEQYETLLAEKNRKLAEASDADSDSDRRITLRSRLARFLSSLR